MKKTKYVKPCIEIIMVQEETFCQASRPDRGDEHDHHHHHDHWDDHWHGWDDGWKRKDGED